MAEEDFSNWNFSDITHKDTQYLTHCFHPYPAKFIPQIPRRLIELYASHHEDIVLDPFCGSGTTLVEAKLMGRPSIGIDTNPLAIMISRSKVNPVVKKQLVDFVSWLDYWKRNDMKTPQSIDNYPDERSAWFREDILAQINLIMKRIVEIKNPNTNNFVKVGLSSILKGVSNARMDRIIPTLPKKHTYIDRKHYNREVDNDSRAINVFARLSSRLRLMQSRLDYFLPMTGNTKALAYLGDARRLDNVRSDLLREGRVKLVVTSCPYWSAFDYQKIHKLSLGLLNLRRTSLEAEIGHGDFLSEMATVYEQISKYLMRNGIFCLVIGRSRKRVNKKLAQMGSKYEMPLREKFTRKIRNHSFFIKGIKSEEILVFQRS